MQIDNNLFDVIEISWRLYDKYDKTVFLRNWIELRNLFQVEKTFPSPPVWGRQQILCSCSCSYYLVVISYIESPISSSAQVKVQ